LTGIIPQLKAKPESNADFVVQLQAADEQLERMNQIVTYQLQRAVQTNNAGSLSRRVNIAEATNKVIDALQKVYADKHMLVVREFDKAVQFVGDERDLMEVLGNVLDNAYKYGESEIKIRVGRESGASRAAVLQVDDNGKGIPNERLAYVLQRGARADTLAQGQGIGLAVVADIVESYGGEIEVSSSSLGGAAVTISFPPPQTYTQ
jgi:two-component system sensor histidine kinase PhoQ